MNVADIVAKLRVADAASFAVLERSLVADTRKGVIKAVEAARRRIEAEAAEAARVAGLYTFEREIAAAHCARAPEDAVIVGLDEVGRGPIAGPLAVGAVVLSPDAAPIAGLNDSKQIKPEARKIMADEIKSAALASSVQFIEAADIDAHGMTACLKRAFSTAVSDIEKQGYTVDVILLDGNPLHFDEREVNIVKGDAKCASIAAASIIAKVERDALMVAYDEQYPPYGFASNKGYGSAEHIEAIKRFGLTPLHRATFCTAFFQESLF